MVDPYAVFGGRIIAANPWDGDVSYDYASAPWYSQALESGGEVIFTHVYTDAVYGRPVITAAQSCAQGSAVMAFEHPAGEPELRGVGARQQRLIFPL